MKSARKRSSDVEDRRQGFTAFERQCVIEALRRLRSEPGSLRLTPGQRAHILSRWVAALHADPEQGA